MKRTFDLTRLALLALGLGLVAPSCDSGTQAAAPGATTSAAVTPPAPAKRTPTPEDALRRSREYWAAAEKADWVATYDYLSPELQKEQPLANFLERKKQHIYKNMRVHEVVAQKDDQIFLRVGGLWTPNHPEVKKVKLEPGQTLTQDVEMIEIWRWVGEEWRLQRPLRPEEFLELYPDLQAAPK